MEDFELLLAKLSRRVNDQTVRISQEFKKLWTRVAAIPGQVIVKFEPSPIETLQSGPSLWQVTYEFSTGAGLKNYVPIGFYFRSNGRRESIAVADSLVAPDLIRIELALDHEPIAGELIVFVAIGGI